MANSGNSGKICRISPLQQALFATYYNIKAVKVKKIPVIFPPINTIKFSYEKQAKIWPDPNLKLMDQVRRSPLPHYAYRTEQAYCQWIVRLIRFFDAKVGSSAESLVDHRFRRFAKCMKYRKVYDFKTFENVGFFRGHFRLVVETLYGTQGNLLFGTEKVENQAPMRAQHPGNLLHRLDP
jgi:hypothetical protein